MNKSVLITHGAWVAVVAGAFALGEMLETKGSESSEKPGLPGTGSKSAYRATIGGPGSTRSSSRASTKSRELADAMAALRAEADEGLRENRAHRLIDGLTPEVLAGLTDEMVPDLLKLFRDVRFTFGASRRTVDAYQAFVGAWARLDPAAAVAYMADRANDYKMNPAGEFKGHPSSESWYVHDANEAAREAAIAELAKVDLAAAKNFAAGVEDEKARKHMTMGLMRHLAATDLDGAIAFSAELEAARGDTTEHLELPYLVSQLKEQRGMEGVGRWLEGVEHVAPDDGSLSYKQSAVASLGLASMGESSQWGENFVDFLAENANEPFITSEMLRKSSRWNSSVNLNLLVELPEEIGARRQAVGDAFEEYLNQDFKEAGNWLLRQRLEPVHDEAILVYVRQATMDDVSVAMRWAEQITDPLLRAETVRYVRERGGK